MKDRETDASARSLGNGRTPIFNIFSVDGISGIGVLEDKVESFRRVALARAYRNRLSRAVPVNAEVEGLPEISQLEIIVVVDIVGVKGEAFAVDENGGGAAYFFRRAFVRFEHNGIIF
jgi:hypothetical protein